MRDSKVEVGSDVELRGREREVTPLELLALLHRANAEVRHDGQVVRRSPRSCRAKGNETPPCCPISLRTPRNGNTRALEASHEGCCARPHERPTEAPLQERLDREVGDEVGAVARSLPLLCGHGRQVPGMGALERRSEQGKPGLLLPRGHTLTLRGVMGVTDPSSQARVTRYMYVHGCARAREQHS